MSKKEQFATPNNESLTVYEPLPPRPEWKQLSPDEQLQHAIKILGQSTLTGLYEVDHTAEGEQLAQLKLRAYHELTRDSLPLVYLGLATDLFHYNEKIRSTRITEPSYHEDNSSIAGLRAARNRTLTLLALSYGSISELVEAEKAIDTIGKYDRVYDTGSEKATGIAKLKALAIVGTSCANPIMLETAHMLAAQSDQTKDFFEGADETFLVTPHEYFDNDGYYARYKRYFDEAGVEGIAKYMWGPYADYDHFSYSSVVALYAVDVEVESGKDRYFNAAEFKPINE